VPSQAAPGELPRPRPFSPVRAGFSCQRAPERLMSALKPGVMTLAVAVSQGRIDDLKEQIFGLNEQVRRRGPSD
jgi:hypothetical protein